MLFFFKHRIFPQETVRKGWLPSRRNDHLGLLANNASWLLPSYLPNPNLKKKKKSRHEERHTNFLGLFL